MQFRMAVLACQGLFPFGQTAYLMLMLRRENNHRAMQQVIRYRYPRGTNIMSIARLADEMRSTWTRYRSYRNAIRQLSALDDRQLHDIGVERGRIPDLVRSGR